MLSCFNSSWKPFVLQLYNFLKIVLASQLVLDLSCSEQCSPYPNQCNEIPPLPQDYIGFLPALFLIFFLFSALTCSILSFWLSSGVPSCSYSPHNCPQSIICNHTGEPTFVLPSASKHREAFCSLIPFSFISCLFLLVPFFSQHNQFHSFPFPAMFCD